MIQLHSNRLITGVSQQKYARKTNSIHKHCLNALKNAVNDT